MAAIYDDARADALVAQGVKGVMDRLGLCREILEVRSRLEQAPVVSLKGKARANALAQRRISALRSILLPGYKASSDSAAVDDLLVPATAKKTLGALIEQAAGGSASDRISASLLVGDLVGMLRRVNAAELDYGLTRTNVGLLDVASAAQSLIPDEPADTPQLLRGHISAKPIMDAAIEAGKFTEEQKGLLQAAAQQAQEFSQASRDAFAPEESQELRALHARFDAYSSELKQLVEAKSGAAKLAGPDSDAFKQAKQRYEELFEEYLNWHRNVYEKRAKELNAAIKEKRAAFMTKAVELHGQLMDDINRDNPVTVEQAEAWARDKVTITPAAVARLRRQGYLPEQVRKDFAEFYRFARGRVDKLVIDTKGDKRANATDINTHGKAGIINLDSAFDKKTLWHEAGHHIEADPAARAAASLYIRYRSVDGKQYTLRSMKGGHKGFKPNEVAYECGFFSSYVGKVYRDGFTEVFSMGCETFSDPALLAQRMAVDPQTLEFVLGYIRSPKTTLAQLHQSMRESMRETTEDADSQAEDATAARIKQLADSLALEDIDPQPWLSRTRAAWIVERDGAQYVGAVKAGEKTLYVYSSKRVRNAETKRYGAGYLVYEDDGTDNGGTFDMAIPTKDKDSMRAVVATWAQAAQSDGMYELAYRILSGDNLKL